MQFNPYLSFNGRCRAAFEFYEKCFGGKIVEMVTNGESPMAAQIPPESHNRIMHARLTVGDRTIMGSDVPAEHYQEAKGISVLISIDEPAESERLFAALSENANITMPIQQTFWATRFGTLTDQFGTPWMINCEQAT
jgi:PhnB protein